MPRKKTSPFNPTDTSIVPVTAVAASESVVPQTEIDGDTLESERPIYYGSSIPLTGKAVKAMVKHFCAKPVKDDDTGAKCSIGIAKDSIVATDGRSAILVGDRALHHYCTERKEAEIEAFRAVQYDRMVQLDDIARRVSPTGTGEVLEMPAVQRTIDGAMKQMKSLVVLDPKILSAIGKCAEDFGAYSVELFHNPESDPDKPRMICFQFSVYVEQPDLMADWRGAVTATGVCAGRNPIHQTKAGADTTEEDPEEIEEP